MWIKLTIDEINSTLCSLLFFFFGENIPIESSRKYNKWRKKNLNPNNTNPSCHTPYWHCDWKRRVRGRLRWSRLVNCTINDMHVSSKEKVLEQCPKSESSARVIVETNRNHQRKRSHNHLKRYQPPDKTELVRWVQTQW